MIPPRIRQIAKGIAGLLLLLSVSPVLGQSITNPIAQLKNHITGVALLTPAQIVAQGNSIQANIRQVGTNDVALAAALDLVSVYDSTDGASFTTASTKNGFARDGTGFELEQALFDLQQGLLDYSYTPTNLFRYFDLLNNTKFGTCSYFPGAVTPPANTNIGYQAVINATHAEAWGSPVLYADYAARRPTGCYLAPGSVAYVTVTPALVNKGFNVRVEAHSWDLTAKTTLKRLDRVSLVYPITSSTTRIANPLGGGIYIEVPYKTTNGLVTVGLTNVVRSPFFSATSFHQTTEAEWLVERANPGKWADFESDKFMMQVPRSWIFNYAYSNAVSVMQDWDSAMDAVSDLMGRPRLMPKTVMYAQPDVLYRTTVNAPGYPMSNDPYDPNASENGNKNHYFLTGPQNSPWTTLHELGHAQLFTKFTGESESAVNLLYVAAMNQKFGVALGAAHGESIGNAANSNINLNQAALSWIMINKFRAGQDMADTDMKYQHRGHGKYTEIASLFGWGRLSNFWYSVNVDYMNGITYLINSDPTDSRILRMSKAAGADLRPLIHMWGIKPVNANSLKTSIQNAGLKPSVLIYNRLKTYQGIVPVTLAQFRSHYNVMKGSLNDADKAWYDDMYNNFTPDIGYGSIAMLQSIIDLYFPDGPPVTARWSGAASGVWNTTTTNWTAVPSGSPATYSDTTPGDGVLFDDTLAANPAITLNSTVNPSGVLFSNLSTAYSLSGSGRIAGVGPLTKEGAGALMLSGTHTFSGGISINGGLIFVPTGSSCSNSDLRILAGATNSVQIILANGQWACRNLTASNNSYFDFNFGTIAPGTTTAPLLANGNVNITGAKILVRSSNALSFGQYPLIKYAGALSGTLPGNPIALPVLPPGASGLLVNNAANQSIDLLVTTLTPLTWGAGNGTWDIGGTPNWRSNGVAVTYSDGKEVIFDDTASGSTPIAISNAVSVSPLKVTANLTNKNYTIQGSSIAGNTSVIKNGPGMLTVSNSHTYNGGTFISGGTLKLGSANPLGPGAVTVQDGATLDLAGFGLTNKANYVVHIAGAGVAGNGALIDSAGGQLNFALTNLVLDADAIVGGSSRFDIRPVTANNLTPTVDLAGHTLTKVGANQFWLQEANVTAGYLVAQSGVLGLNTINVTNGSIVVKSGAELRLFRAVTTAPCYLTRPITLEGGALLSYTGRETADPIDQTIASPIILDGDATVLAGNSLADSFGSVLELAGSISGDYGLTKAGTNTVLLSGTNSYLGTTTISAGILRLGSTNAIPSGVNEDDEDSSAGNLMVNVSGTLDLNGVDAILNGLSGSGIVDSVPGGNVTLTLGINNATSTFTGTIRNTAGVTSVLKAGTGTQTFAGGNTYSGGTLLSGGTLFAGNTTGSATGVGPVTVRNGGALAGNGSINGAVVIEPSGILAPGLTGRLTITSNLTSYGTIVMNIGRNPSGLTNDLIAGIRTNTYGGVLVITNAGSSPLQPGDSFLMFSATNYAGQFASIIVPPGYTFSDTLSTDGRITVASVIAPSSPSFPAGGITLTGNGSIQLTATGSIGATYRLWVNTNLGDLSSNAWNVVVSGTVTNSPFTIIDNTTNAPQRFYRFSAP